MIRKPLDMVISEHKIHLQLSCIVLAISRLSRMYAPHEFITYRKSIVCGPLKHDTTLTTSRVCRSRMTLSSGRFTFGAVIRMPLDVMCTRSLGVYCSVPMNIRTGITEV